MPRIPVELDICGYVVDSLVHVIWQTRACNIVSFCLEIVRCRFVTVSAFSACCMALFVLFFCILLRDGRIEAILLGLSVCLVFLQNVHSGQPPQQNVDIAQRAVIHQRRRRAEHAR